MKFLLILSAALILLAAVLLIRALRFRPREEERVEAAPVSLDRDKIIDNFREMIRCRTVSNRDTSLVDYGEFDRFEALLASRYPKIHALTEKTKISTTGLLFRLAGQSSEKPTVLMAHYDVVPVEEDCWEKPPFEAVLEDGVIWGRGTLDTKGTLCAVMESVEQALENGYVPKNDLYLAFSGEEETDGPTCRAMVSYLEERGVRPALVLDEGGAVVDKVFPGVECPCALIGVAEKGSMSFDLSLIAEGGHASTPPPHTILGRLCRAATAIEKNPFPGRLTPVSRRMFDAMGRHSGFGYRLIFANLWFFFPILDRIARKSGGDMNALLRTTVAVTRMSGSKAYNVLPSKASLGINVRILAGDTMESVRERILKLAKDEEIAIHVKGGMDPSIISDTDCEGWDAVCTATRATWPGILVSPYLMMACSDSRYYCRISDKVYRFSAMYLSKQERDSIHGHNEKIPVDTLIRAVEFYARLLPML